ncbi:MAG: dihydropteroate synthase [Anaerolineae bacterium]|jgi:dihydropteroate synthase
MSRYNVRLLRCDSTAALVREMQSIGADPQGIGIMAPKARLCLIRAEGLKLSAASILKQELLSKGGDAALSGKVYHGGEHTTDVLIMGSRRTLGRVIRVLRRQPLPSLHDLAEELQQALRNEVRPVAASCCIGGHEFVWGRRTYIMGILNVTPDSFSGDGLAADTDSPEVMVKRAVAQAMVFLEEGADIIDIGGESTRPGAGTVDAETEIARVVPIIRALRQETDAPISVDTYKAPVARAALDAGANMINDVWAMQMDPEMMPLAVERNVPVVLMHNRSKPHDAEQRERLGGRYVGVRYDDLMADIVRDLRQLVDNALAAGIAPERIIIDPGIGFGKTVDQNLALLNHADELRVLGFPILLGPSRKSFIGYTLDLPPDERVEGTLAAAVVGVVRRAADIMRVHDVRAVARAVRMADAITRAD